MTPEEERDALRAITRLFEIAATRKQYKVLELESDETPNPKPSNENEGEVKSKD